MTHNFLDLVYVFSDIYHLLATQFPATSHESSKTPGVSVKIQSTNRVLTIRSYKPDRLAKFCFTSKVIRQIAITKEYTVN